MTLKVTGAGGSFPKRDIPRLAESIRPPAGAGGFLQRGENTLKSENYSRQFISREHTIGQDGIDVLKLAGSRIFKPIYKW